MNKIILTLAALVLIFVENSQQEERGGRFFDLNNPDYKSIYPWPKESSIGTKEESPKGQLISKFPNEIIVSSKMPTKIFLDFCPEIFCTCSWGLGEGKKNSGLKSRINFVGILDKTIIS